MQSAHQPFLGAIHLLPLIAMLVIYYVNYSSAPHMHSHLQTAAFCFAVDMNEHGRN
jgi:hypothetical protein